MYVCMYVCIFDSGPLLNVPRMYVCMYVCMYVRMYYAPDSLLNVASMYVCMYVLYDSPGPQWNVPRMYVFMFACMPHQIRH